ncbi:MAG: O-antigen ligase family protein [Bacteroidetes bacterium]|nr:O-antigen ligase family protein [Bacteroidota bacterium]MBI3482306.1 O-antigen ligase family protein [Bacteroidota bacterium]
MNFLSKENPDRWRHLAWWLCVITLPWIDMANNISLILLFMLSLTGGNLKERLLRIKSAKWAWPFFIYYAMLLVGMTYTADIDNGFFTLDKKITFVVLPLIAIVGKQLNEEFVSLLKRNFVYSCTGVIFLCLTLATVSFISGGSPENFDFRSSSEYNDLHPNASSFWMHFSYIQLAQWAGLHPAYFSMYLVFCLTILFTEKYSSRKEQTFHLLLSLIICCFIAMLSARMAIIVFIFSAFYLIVKKIQAKQLAGSFTIFVAMVTLGFLLSFNPVTRFRLIEEPLKTKYVADTSVTDWNSVSYRLLEWQGTWGIIQHHLFFGIGTSGWKIAMDNFYSRYNSSTVGLVHNSHNQFLQTWMENGILALIAFLVCIFGSVFRPNVEPSYVAFILIFSLMCLTESIGERQKGIVFFTLFQTLFLAFENKSK